MYLVWLKIKSIFKSNQQVLKNKKNIPKTERNVSIESTKSIETFPCNLNEMNIVI